MHNAVRNLLLASSIGLGWCPEAVAQVCDRALDFGTFSYQRAESKNYARFLLAAKLANMSETEARKAIDSGGNYGAIAGHFKYDNHKSFKSHVESYINIDQVLANESVFLLSAGDPTILNAWNTCIANTGGGLTVVLGRISNGEAVLTIKARRFPTGPEPKITAPPYLSSQGRVVSDKKLFSSGATLPRDNLSRDVVIRFPPRHHVTVSLNTNVGDRTVWIPAIPDIPALETDKPAVARTRHMLLRTIPGEPNFYLTSDGQCQDGAGVAAVRQALTLRLIDLNGGEHRDGDKVMIACEHRPAYLSVSQGGNLFFSATVSPASEFTLRLRARQNGSPAPDGAEINEHDRVSLIASNDLELEAPNGRRPTATQSTARPFPWDLGFQTNYEAVNPPRPYP